MKKARYRVTSAGPNQLTYEDEIGAVTLWTEPMADPPGWGIDVIGIPADFHLSRDELIERIWQKQSWWRGTFRFYDERGRELIPPSLRGPDGDETYR